ncbi:MAG: type 4a pilus biogenesis protein PilO [Gammaproteobacteria bacterium]
MSIADDINSLDVNDIGRAPFWLRVVLIVLIFAIVSGFGVWQFVIKSKKPQLEQVQAKEQDLRDEFSAKQRKAANLDAYRRQLEEMETNLGAMLKQLPGRTEIPSLLVDISQTGLASGLQEELFQPMPEARKEVFAEKPIKIRLKGDYHELGKFVSDIAELPRIVVLEDVEIDGSKGLDNLTMSVTAKTFRYLDPDDVAEEEAK